MSEPRYDYHEDRPAEVPCHEWRREKYLLDPTPRVRCEPPGDGEYGYRWVLHEVAQ